MSSFRGGLRVGRVRLLRLAAFAAGLALVAPRPLRGQAVNEFPIGTQVLPLEIALGPDGNLWFTENVGKIGRMTPAGEFTHFTPPTASSGAQGIAAGPDGNLWFTESNVNKIGRVTTSGDFTEFPIPTAGARPFGIVAGPDGNLWFTESQANKIGRITPGGVITEFPIATPSASPRSIAAGSDVSAKRTQIEGLL